MIRFICECGKELQGREENAGRQVICPSCGRQQVLPNVNEDAIQASEAASAPANVTADVPPRRAARDSSSEDATPAGTSGKATTSLILGLLSVFCNILTGFPAAILGILALRDIDRSRGRLSGHGLAIAGITCACVGTLLSCLSLGLLALLLPGVQKVREAAARQQSSNNLKQMGLAMLNYNDTYGHLPSAAICDKAGKPLLSWRVAILPYIEQQLLYAQFKLDEPWDSPNNKRLLAQMPKIYNNPSVQTPADETIYQVFVGNGAAFEKTRSFKIPQDFPDGTSNTILIVEAHQSVPWTKPDDLAFDPSKSIMPLLGDYSRNSFLVGLADGSVRTVTRALSENSLKAAITRNGNELLGPDW